jgi:hypothetical protein
LIRLLNKYTAPQSNGQALLLARNWVKMFDIICKESDTAHVDQQMRQALLATYNIDSQTLERLFEDFLSIYDKDINTWIQERHLELQRAGIANENIFRQILEELPNQRFIAPHVSIRQIRRIIYG